MLNESMLNVLVGFGIENAWFGPWPTDISQLWPELLYPVDRLVTLRNVIEHQPEQY